MESSTSNRFTVAKRALEQLGKHGDAIGCCDSFRTGQHVRAAFVLTGAERLRGHCGDVERIDHCHRHVSEGFAHHVSVL